jgi:hypothetical protein
MMMSFEVVSGFQLSPFMAAAQVKSISPAIVTKVFWGNLGKSTYKSISLMGWRGGAAPGGALLLWRASIAVSMSGGIFDRA